MGETTGLKSLDVYHQSADPERYKVKWVVGAMGLSATFHIDYAVDRADGWCRYALDGDKDSDIIKADGAYQVYAVGDHTRLVYRSQSESGRRMPGFVKRWLAHDSLMAQLKGISKRAGR